MRKNLIAERKSMGLTQVQAANALLISERQYQAIESGYSKGSIDFWERAKDLFNTTIDALLEHDTEQ